MNKQNIKHKLRELLDNEEYELIEKSVTALPDSLIDDDILNVLCSAYFNLKEYKKAIALLEGQRKRLDDDYKWHFRMGLALYNVSSDEECEEDDELRRNILERAKVEFARAMHLYPSEQILNSADRYMEKIDSALDELDEEDDREFAPEMYDDEEIEAIEEHIKEYFGDFPTVFHEIVSPDIHCDIYIIPPTKEKDYFTLVTVGMGAHIMDIPEELDSAEYGRAELLICLPSSWKVGENTEEWFWPIRTLKSLSRLPINCETWLGWGHSVDNGQCFAENTQLCGSLLVYPENVEPGADYCLLPNGERVNFFEVIPIYREEMSFKLDNDTQALLEIMNGISHIVDINRENVCEGYTRKGFVDSSYEHSSKITEKNLPVEEINGCNHLAIFLRWCIEHDLYNKDFFDSFSDIADEVKKGEITDLRPFINECLGGELNDNLFRYPIGSMFVQRYYNFNQMFPDIFFPADVDECAKEYFGEEKYNSEEFQDEAYLFVPFDEDYYKRLSKYIENAYEIFYCEFTEHYYYDKKTAVMSAEKCLDCECIFPKDPQSIVKILKDSENQNFSPLLLIIDDFYGEKDCTDEEELARTLYFGNEPFFMPIVVAKMPKDSLPGTFSEKKKYVLSSDEIKSGSERLRKKFGVKPAVLGLSENGCSLMLPQDNGDYLLLKGE